MSFIDEVQKQIDHELSLRFESPFAVGDFVAHRLGPFEFRGVWLGTLEPPIEVPGTGSWVAHFAMWSVESGFSPISNEWLDDFHLLSAVSGSLG